MKLAIVTCCFNPSNSEYLWKNYKEFVDTLGPYKDRLTTSVLHFDGDSQLVIGACGKVLRFVGNKSDHTLWQKESLLNAAISVLDPSYDAVAWIDNDVIFNNPSWLDDTEKALENQSVIQMFSRCNYVDSDGKYGLTRVGLVSHRRRITSGSAFGLAWAARREVLENGLFDRVITGGGDAFMADAFLGRLEQRRRYCKPPMWSCFRKWADLVVAKVKGSTGFLNHTISHLYHGEFSDRRYGFRSKLLREYNFDPMKDIAKDGVLYRWTGNNPRLELAVKTWMTENLYSVTPK